MNRPVKHNEHYINALILQAARQANILPITSVCNVACLFCSHRQNPQGVESFHIGHRTLEEIRSSLAFINPQQPVIIGESVTRVMEGEPFYHPQFPQILEEVRRRFPHTPIQITTNGTMLDQATVEWLAELSPITIYLSLNSACSANRRLQMKDRWANRSVEAARLLGERGIEYQGSIVAMPWITGWDDLTRTITHLDRCGAQVIRIFLPGYTRLAKEELKFPLTMWDQLRSFVGRVRQQVRVPVVCEPPKIDNFKPEIVGIIPGSAADRAGLKPGDILVAVSGKPVLTRVHGFHLTYQLANPMLEIQRENRPLAVPLTKGARERSGLVMDYDLDPALFEDIRKVVRFHRASQVLLLTSPLAYTRMVLGVNKFYPEPGQLKVCRVASRFFGGSIMAAGLLTVADFSLALQQYLAASATKPELILLPAIAFDQRGRDLTGETYHKLAETFGIQVEVI